MAQEFVGQSRALGNKGIAEAAQSLSVKAQEVWAVLSVETSGCGFLPDRRPQILFERHIFHRLTKGQFDDGDISDPRPGGYGEGGAHQYDRLARAIGKDREAALRSTSWGLGQVLGDNFKDAGFQDLETMVTEMSDSEDTQLMAVVSFIQKNGLDVHLRTHDWAAFARGYNGSSFAKNHYDIRLRGEFQKFSAGMMPDLAVRTTQLYLTFLGFHPGPVDGIEGERTRSALAQFQEERGLAVTGKLSDKMLELLEEAVLS